MTRTGIFSALARYVAWARLRRRQVRTIRLLASLPPEIQADIGWPDFHVATDGFVCLPPDIGQPDSAVAQLRPPTALPGPAAQHQQASWKLPSLPPRRAA